MFSRFVLVEILTFPFNRWLLGKTDQTFVILLFLHFLLWVSQLSEFINDNCSRQVRYDDFKECPVDGIREESSIMAAVSNPTRGLSYDPLRK